MTPDLALESVERRVISIRLAHPVLAAVVELLSGSGRFEIVPANLFYARFCGLVCGLVKWYREAGQHRIKGESYVRVLYHFIAQNQGTPQS